MATRDPNAAATLADVVAGIAVYRAGRGPELTRDVAVRMVLALARGLREEADDLAVARLLERVANGDPQLRDALIDIGARAAINAATRMA